MNIEITYLNIDGSSKAIQIKKVIPHSIFDILIKPAKERLYILGQIPQKKIKPEEILEIDALNRALIPYRGEWCTDQSPLGLSIKTGILSLTENQGGDHNVKIKIIS